MDFISAAFYVIDDAHKTQVVPMETFIQKADGYCNSPLGKRDMEYARLLPAGTSGKVDYRNPHYPWYEEGAGCTFIIIGYQGNPEPICYSYDHDAEIRMWNCDAINGAIGEFTDYSEGIHIIEGGPPKRWSSDERSYRIVKAFVKPAYDALEASLGVMFSIYDGINEYVSAGVDVNVGKDVFNGYEWSDMYEHCNTPGSPYNTDEKYYLKNECLGYVRNSEAEDFSCVSLNTGVTVDIGECILFDRYDREGNGLPVITGKINNKPSDSEFYTVSGELKGKMRNVFVIADKEQHNDIELVTSN